MNREMTVRELFEKMSKCDLFMGKYDAKNSSEIFMYGVGTVMEYITAHIDEETLEKFSDDFIKNMLDSEKNV